MTAMKNLHDLYVEQLKDLYSAETQLVEALPKMAQAASNPQLQQGFLKHLGQTQQQVQRLESVFADLGMAPGGHTCKAMQGLIAEGNEMIQEQAAPEVKDAGLIACAQRVEHYEIAGYGTVARYAEVLGQQGHLEVLRVTENEEKATDKELTMLADTINQAAARA
ncbi:ferritin-like domain-containing protein [Deinococcus multiflagellatus]|uniref:Ferritin-like domain-containing protein n=1 Tax=Deinococcus multiflagellatus TaxID=1656887 RepID=A0ABW1ZNY3_9DEIO|nr:ferritin-like domain-containing protein [Deinococcus multiflagellatus]MBZ9713483.1 ferritin-like domain-containing protein [Deinococcus multiflagellatus]